MRSTELRRAITTCVAPIKSAGRSWSVLIEDLNEEVSVLRFVMAGKIGLRLQRAMGADFLSLSTPPFSQSKSQSMILIPA